MLAELSSSSAPWDIYAVCGFALKALCSGKSREEPLEARCSSSQELEVDIRTTDCSVKVHEVLGKGFFHPLFSAFLLSSQLRPLLELKIFPWRWAISFPVRVPVFLIGHSVPDWAVTVCCGRRCSFPCPAYFYPHHSLVCSQLLSCLDVDAQ